MNLEQENKELQRYIRELKQEIKNLRDQLNFVMSKDQQVKPENHFLYWHTEPGKPRTLEDDIYDTYYKPLDNREIGGENGY